MATDIQLIAVRMMVILQLKVASEHVISIINAPWDYIHRILRTILTLTSYSLMFVKSS